MAETIDTPEAAANFLRLIAEALDCPEAQCLIKTRAVELGIKQTEGAAKMAIFLQAVCFVRCDFNPESRLRPYLQDPSPLLASIRQFEKDPGVQRQCAAIKAGMCAAKPVEPDVNPTLHRSISM